MDISFTYEDWDGQAVELSPDFGVYANQRLAISFVDSIYGEQWATVTTNLPDQHLNEGEVFVKDWSENEPIVRQLVGIGWLVPAGREVIAGHVAPKVMTLAGDLKLAFDEWKATQS